MTTAKLRQMKVNGEKIAMLTSYDFTLASLVDEAGIDMLLVGDSASNVVCGNGTTLPITVDEMIFLTKGVVRAAQHALVVCDMPFGSYQVSEEEAVRNAIKILKESGCDAVKLEGGEEKEEQCDQGPENDLQGPESPASFLFLLSHVILSLCRHPAGPYDEDRVEENHCERDRGHDVSRGYRTHLVGNDTFYLREHRRSCDCHHHP